MDNFNRYKIIKRIPHPQKLSKCVFFLHIRGAINGICKGPKPLHRYNPPKKKKKKKTPFSPCAPPPPPAPQKKGGATIRVYSVPTFTHGSQLWLAAFIMQWQ